jgi:hypothetical protein
MSVKEQPKISPFSLAVWQDVKNPNQWNWSVHCGSTVRSKGHALDYNVACQQARDEMGKLVKK